MIFTDSVMSEIAKKINVNVEWCLKSCTLNDIDDSMLHEAQKADIVILMVGAADIRNGMKGLEAFSKYKSLAQKLCASTKVIVTEIPPSIQQGVSGHISLFNYKLNKLADLSPQIQYIPSNSGSVLKHEILDENDELSLTAIAMVAKAVNEATIVPDTLKSQNEARPCTDTPHDYRTIELVPLKSHQIGRVIGQQGSTISNLSKKYGVTMRIGRWMERSRDRKQEMEQKMEGVIITGLLDNVIATAEFIRSLINKTDFNEKAN
jgi:hypothetical protein